MTTPTLRERLARVETLIEGLIEHNRVRDRWTLRIIAGLVVGVILMGLPGCVRLLNGV